MKLQLALDDITLEDAMELVDKVHDYVDIVEIGSPFIIDCGMEPVKRIKAKYPELEVLADTKIMEQSLHTKLVQITVQFSVLQILLLLKDALTQQRNMARKYLSI